MARQRKLFITHAGALAHHLVRAVRPHAMIADFARSYAQRHGRACVVDEPGRVRELESTLGREAILVMVAYHFCFDLSVFHLMRADFNTDPFWLMSRALIVSIFLLIAGASAVLAS